MEALTGWLLAPGAEEMCWLRVDEPSAEAGARKIAATMARRLAFPTARAQQLSLAVTEAASNLHKHAKDGTLLLRVCRDAGMVGIELVTIDSGPGIADLGNAQRDGHSTAGTLGIGLGAIRRIADSCDMYSRPGGGTALVARFWPRPRPRFTVGYAGLLRPISGESECGDSYAAHQAGGALIGLLCDGLGHGPLAAAASRAAVAAVREAPDDDPAALLARVHRGMGKTRGGAVGIARIEGQAVSFAGLGNVAGWIVTGNDRHGMISMPGIAGLQGRKIRQYEYRLPPGAVVVLHSDGLSSRWDVTKLPGLMTRDPLVVAAVLLQDAGVHRDDGGVLVLKL